MVSISTKKGIKKMRALFISKNKNGTLNFGVIDDYGDVVAIGKARDGLCFNIYQIDNRPSCLLEVHDFIRKAEMTGELKCE